MAEPVRVYWQPGCTSCLRVKEYLGANGIDFVSVNVAADAAGWDELARLGLRSVPVVARGERYVFAQVLGAVSDFLGLDEAAGPKLAPAALVARLALILETACRLTAQVPEDRRDYSLPGRDRSLHGLAYHIFQIPEVFLACQAGAELTYEALDEPAPDRLASMADIAAYAPMSQGASTPGGTPSPAATAPAPSPPISASTACTWCWSAPPGTPPSTRGNWR